MTNITSEMHVAIKLIKESPKSLVYFRMYRMSDTIDY